MKRAFDILGASVFILLAAPIWIPAVLLILIVDPGPILYVQSRIGRKDKLFKLYKFRTMYQNTSSEHSRSVTLQNDPRIIPGGHLLRKFKLDELPQLLNVLDGTMSIVGPRPTVEEDYQKMNQEQRQRHSVRPGITGLAQISGNTSLPWEKRIEYDLAYIKKQSLSLDLWILARTVLLVVTGRAETHPPSENEWENQ